MELQLSLIQSALKFNRTISTPTTTLVIPPYWSLLFEIYSDSIYALTNEFQEGNH